MQATRTNGHARKERHLAQKLFRDSSLVVLRSTRRLQRPLNSRVGITQQSERFGIGWGLPCRRVVLPEGVRPARIELADQKIVDITPEISPSLSERDGLDVGDLVIMPGLVDTHVHLNEPGRREWEGFWTGTRDARSRARSG